MIYYSVSCMIVLLMLQEAFKTRMSEFVSHSCERQRYIRLRSQERRLQQLEANERQRLFGHVQPQHSALALSEPAVGMHPLLNHWISLSGVDGLCALATDMSLW